MAGLLALLLDGFVVSGVVWPYIPQARAMREARDASAFSTHTSLIVIVSATLRLFFWFGKRFGTALLLQAVASIAAQLYMLRVVVGINNDVAAGRGGGANGSGGGAGASGALVGAALHAPRRAKERSFLDFKVADFWRWTDWESYLLFHATLFVALLALTGLFHPAAWYTEAIGTLSLGVEALLPLPQALANHRRGSTDGLSTVLIGSWVAGDLFKTAYAVGKGEPAQFIACGAAQLCVDLVIVAQMARLTGTPMPSSPSAGHLATLSGGAAGATRALPRRSTRDSAKP
jgi:hypothetical protein